jgi:phage terminase small subunit
MGTLSNPRHEAFCLEYMKDRNGTAAYKRVGYKSKNDGAARSNASRLLTNDNVGVPLRIAELEVEYAAKIGFEIEDALNKYLSIINAKPAELTALVRGACRYCHGINHDYQWRTDREFIEGTKKHLCSPNASMVHAVEPTDDGGYPRAPH